jgi:carbohydrate kinase (thermoresistant glucokinase family)
VILIVAGVSGSGKTTVGALVAGRLRWRFADADGFHPQANIDKMNSGTPLTDEDREPWLQAITDWMDERLSAGESGVITCSALKRVYRDRLLDGRPAATMIFLQVSRQTLAERLRTRPGHFFPEKLLDSQLATLEPPSANEDRVDTITSEGGTEQTAAAVIAAIWLDGEPTGDSMPVPGVL